MAIRNRLWARWTTHRHQLHLGRSDEGTLKIVDLPGLHKDLHRVSPFDELPDDLLLAIVEFASTSTDYNAWSTSKWNTPDRATTIALTLVCRRFNRISTPIIFRALNYHMPPSAKSRAFSRMPPSHRQYCRTLSINGSDIRSPGVADWPIMNDFLTGCTGVRCLSVHGGFDKSNAKTWELIKNLIANMPALEELHLSRECWGLVLPQIMKYVDVPTLQVLKIYGVSESRQSIVEKDRTASFTTIELSDYEDDAAATARLIRWPKQLQCFIFESFYNNRHYMDLTMFGSWLSIHKDTLESIEIGYLSAGDGSKRLDVSQFPVLKKLTLSRYSFSGGLSSCDIDANLLLAPKLESFTWSFSINDQHSESWDAFGPKEEKWLKQFAKIATSSSSPLKRIHVIFNPDDYYGSEELEYPWDSLDRVKEYCLELKIVLSYSEPTISKEGWRTSIVEQSLQTEQDGLAEAAPVEESSSESQPVRPQSPSPEGNIRAYFQPIRTSNSS